MCTICDNFTSFLRNLYLEYIYLYVCIFDDFENDNHIYYDNVNQQTNFDYTELDIKDISDISDIKDIKDDKNDTNYTNDRDDINKNFEIELKHYSNDIYNKENKIIIIENPSNISNLRFRKIETEDDFVII